MMRRFLVAVAAVPALAIPSGFAVNAATAAPPAGTHGAVERAVHDRVDVFYGNAFVLGSTGTVVPVVEILGNGGVLHVAFTGATPGDSFVIKAYFTVTTSDGSARTLDAAEIPSSQSWGTVSANLAGQVLQSGSQYPMFVTVTVSQPAGDGVLRLDLSPVPAA